MSLTKTFPTCPWVQQEPSALVAGHDAVDNGIWSSTIPSQGRDAQHFWPDCQGFRDLSGVLRVQEDRLIVVKWDHIHRHWGNGIEVTRQATISGLHLQLKGGRGVGGQRSLQPQDPRKLVQREVATVARQEGVFHLRVYTCRCKWFYFNNIRYICWKKKDQFNTYNLSLSLFSIMQRCILALTDVLLNNTWILFCEGENYLALKLLLLSKPQLDSRKGCVGFMKTR